MCHNLAFNNFLFDNIRNQWYYNGVASSQMAD